METHPNTQNSEIPEYPTWVLKHEEGSQSRCDVLPGSSELTVRIIHSSRSCWQHLPFDTARDPEVFVERLLRESPSHGERMGVCSIVLRARGSLSEAV